MPPTMRRPSGMCSTLEIARDIKNREIESECERTLGELAFEGGDLNAATERFAPLIRSVGGALVYQGGGVSVWRSPTGVWAVRGPVR